MSEIESEDVLEFCRLWRQIKFQYDEYARATGSSYFSNFILLIIYREKGACTQKEICAQTFFPKQTVNIIIKGFLKQGIIRMSEMESDRRNKIIRFTKKGNEYVEKIAPGILEAEKKAIEKIKENERVALLSGLRRYCDNFSEYMQENIRTISKEAKGVKNEE
jgi:DNA-binding MarR family transcriptional regulator